MKKPPKPRGPRLQHLTIWEMPDALWDLVEPLLDAMFPRKGRGRRRAAFRAVINALIWHARTNAQWQEIPERFGVHYSTVHKWMRKWEESGVLDAVVTMLIHEADAMGLVDWEHQVIDGSLSKSRQGDECVGENPTDRGKNGLKRSVIREGNGYPICTLIAPANINDATLLEATLEARVRPIEGASAGILLMDRGYRGVPARAVVEAAGYTYRAPPRDRKDPYAVFDVPLTQDEKNRRAKVEICHAWQQSFRAVLTRYSYKEYAYDAVLNVANMLIWWRRIDSNRLPPIRVTPELMRVS